MAQKDFLKGLSKEQIAQLGLSPEVTSQLEGLQDVSMAPLESTPEPVAPTGSYSQDQIGKQMQADIASRFSSVPDQNLMVAQADPVAFQAMNSGLTSAGMQPAELPAPIQQVQGTLSPDVAAMQQMQAAQEAEAQVIKESAMQKATVEQAARQAADESKKAQEIAAADVQTEARINEDIKEQAPNLGSQIGQAIAIMMGAYSQGLTGSKENPGLVAIEKQAERIAAAKKYNDEQKLKLADMLYKQGQQQIERQKNTIDSMIGLKKLEQASEELSLKRQEINAKLGQIRGVGKLTYTNAERVALQASGPEGRALTETMIRLPNGDWAPTQSNEAAKQITSDVKILDNAIYSAKRLRAAVDFFGNDPAKKLLAFSKKAEVKPDLQALVGGLRLDYFGPGILTEQEQQIARQMMGDPTAIFSIASSNAKALGSIINKLNYAKRVALKSGGIDLPKSKNEQNIEFLMSKGLSQPEAINTLMSYKKWNPDEE